MTPRARLLSLWMDTHRAVLAMIEAADDDTLVETSRLTHALLDAMAALGLAQADRAMASRSFRSEDAS